MLLEKSLRDDVQIGGRFAGEEARELHAVVRGPRLLAESRDLEILAARDQLLEEALAHHAVADDDDSLLAHAALAFGSTAETLAKRTTSPTTMMAGLARRA